MHYLKISLFALAGGLLWMGCASEMKRGSGETLYTIAGVLEVKRQDIGKDIQLTLDQKLFFNMEPDPSEPGKWELVDYERRTLLLLSDTPWTPPGHWGALLQARAMGSGEVTLRFTPADTSLPPRTIVFETWTRK